MKKLLLFGAIALSVGLSAQTNNHSLTLDGLDDMLELSSASSTIQGNNIGSISIAFKASSTASSNNLPLFSIEIAGAADADALVLRIGSGCNASNASISLEDDDCGQSNVTVRASWGSNPALLYDNTWHHLSLIVGINYHQIYLDGSLLNLSYSSGNSAVGGFLFKPNIDQILIGARINNNTPNNGFFKGDVDNIQIWNNPIDSIQIQQYINCPPIGNEAGLVGFWALEEGTGNATADQTSNANDGTLNGGVTWSTDVPAYNCCIANPITSQPTDQTVNMGNDATFSFTDTLSGATYQWQMDAGTGYSDLSNAGQFSGADTKTLTVTSANNE